MATPDTRATDTDRSDICQVLDSALSDGQLSMEEHRQRVSAATKATTLGELQSLMADLQTHNAPVQPPTVKSPASRWGMRIAVAVVLVLLGAGLAWGLFGNNASPSKSTSVSSTRLSGNSPVAVTSTSTSPEAPPLDLLSLGGLSGFFAQMQKQFGDTMGYELNIRSGYAVLFRPDSVNAHKTVDWDYRNGRWIKTGDIPIPSGTTVGDLSKFDVQEVLGVLRGAPQTLQINNPQGHLPSH